MRWWRSSRPSDSQKGCHPLRIFSSSGTAACVQGNGLSTGVLLCPRLTASAAGCTRRSGPITAPPSSVRISFVRMGTTMSIPGAARRTRQRLDGRSPTGPRQTSVHEPAAQAVLFAWFRRVFLGHGWLIVSVRNPCEVSNPGKRVSDRGSASILVQQARRSDPDTVTGEKKKTVQSV